MNTTLVEMNLLVISKISKLLKLKTYFPTKKTIILNCEPQSTFNKNIDLLFEKIENNISNNIKNIISCSSREQEDRFYSLIKGKFDNSQVKIINLSIHEGFCDFLNQVEIFYRSPNIQQIS